MSNRASLVLALTLALPLSTAACSNGEMLHPTGTCSVATFPDSSPVAYGSRALTQALAAAGSSATVRFVLADDPCTGPTLAAGGAVLAQGPESFAIVADGADTVVVGRDEVGAMYGALELVERLQAGETLPPAAPVTGTPDRSFRAGNLFLILPQPGETQDGWWFYDESFWTEYLDMLAHARFNILDLHGMYDIESTIFPNALLHFGTSATYPDVGAPRAERDRNVAMLGRVVAMAAARGIKVTFMTYMTNLALTGNGPAPALTDDQVGVYTREAVADLARHVPDLWRLGFRVWESTHPPSWYADTFVAGVRDSGASIGIYSRSWGTSKGSMSQIAAAASGDMVVEVKFNGDHIGTPYIITGGLVSGTGWWNYSYADYLEPPETFAVVNQIWSLATHRILRHASFDRIRRTVASTKLGTSQGFLLGAPHGLMPMRDDYHASAADRFSQWSFARDELQYQLFGRLAYDPATPEPTFRRIVAQRAGTDSLWDSVQAASDVVPWIQTMHTCGPDQRHFAPDMEWGGPVAYWATPPLTKFPGSPCDTGYHGPLDTLSYATTVEVAADLVHGRATTKLSPLTVVRILLHDAEVARAAATAPIDPSNALAVDLARECVALADLGEYFAHKLRAATALAIYAESASPDYLAAARAETQTADDAWKKLADDTAYIAPFLETMRMKMFGTPIYHWSMQVPQLGDDPASIDAFAAKVTRRQVPVPPASQFLYGVRPDGPGLLSLDVHPPANGEQIVEARFAHDPPPGAVVHVLWKEFSGFADWHESHAPREGDVFRAHVPKADNAGFFAVEVQPVQGHGSGPWPVPSGWRYPDVLSGAPYVSVAP